MNKRNLLACAINAPAGSISDALLRAVDDPTISAADLCLAAVEQHDQRCRRRVCTRRCNRNGGGPSATPHQHRTWNRPAADR
jgi:hypothetical protein